MKSFLFRHWKNEEQIVIDWDLNLKLEVEDWKNDLVSKLIKNVVEKLQFEDEN